MRALLNELQDFGIIQGVVTAAMLTESDVFDPAGRSALIGQPVAPLVFGIYEHYEEHAHEIEAAFA